MSANKINNWYISLHNIWKISYITSKLIELFIGLPSIGLIHKVDNAKAFHWRQWGVDFMKNTVPKVSGLKDWNSAKIQYDSKERWADTEAD